MGLDMYLCGKNKNNEEIELGYWRKHPDLHGYIVQNFAGGVDECQRIPLSAMDLASIVSDIEDKKLPKTEGFFFGSSGPEDDAPSIDILNEAIDWLLENEGSTIYYQASW
jgi:hypothetical protein